MDISKLRELAYSHHNDILVEITTEIKSVDSILKEAAIPVESFRPEIQFAVKHMLSLKQETESISSSIDMLERKQRNMDTHPAIQKILYLEAELKKSGTPQFTNQLSRELQHLKSIHARKISSRVSLQRQLLQDRLHLVRSWKSVLADEIQILEESKKLLIDKIASLAKISKDADLRDEIQNKLREITGTEISIHNSKFDASKVHVANIHVLRETLFKQLNDVASIEDVVGKKRNIVRSLNQIVSEIEQKIVSAPPDSKGKEPERDAPVPAPKKQAASLPSVEDLELPDFKPSRMASRGSRGRR